MKSASIAGIHDNQNKEMEEEDMNEEEELDGAAALSQLMGKMAPQQQMLPSSAGSGVYVAGSLCVLVHRIEIS